MATYYFATTGNDANSGSISSPKRTLAHASTFHAAGDTIYFRGGTWTGEQLAPNKNGQGFNPTVFKAYPGETPIFDGGGAGICAINNGGKSYITYDGFEIKNCRNGAALANATNGETGSASAGSGGTSVKFRNLNCHNNTVAQGGEAVISISWCNTSEIYNCRMEDESPTAGAARAKNSVDCNVHFNYIERINGDGISWPNATRLKINRNTVLTKTIVEGVEQHPDAIVCDNGTITDCIISNNLVVDFTQGIYIAPFAGQLIDGLEIFGNIFFTYLYYTGDEPSEGSPAIFIDKGSASGTVRRVRIVNNSFGFGALKAITVQGTGITQDIICINNLFYRCRGTDASRTAAQFETVTGLVCDYNLCYGVIGAVNQSNENVEGTHSIMGQNPLLTAYEIHDPIATADFRPLVGSPMVNAAHPNPGSIWALPTLYLTDRDGNTRGNPATIGAYEYGVSGPRIMEVFAVPFTPELTATDRTITRRFDPILQDPVSASVSPTRKDAPRVYNSQGPLVRRKPARLRKKRTLS